MQISLAGKKVTKFCRMSSTLKNNNVNHKTEKHFFLSIKLLYVPMYTNPPLMTFHCALTFFLVKKTFH